MPCARIGVAAFDFDGTLTDRDSVVPFVRRVLTVGAVGRLVVYAPALIWSAIRRDRDRFREAATMVVFRNMAYRRVTDAAERYGNDALPSRLRPAMVEIVRQHRANGDRCVIVSASYREYLEPIARLLDVESVLATQLEVIDGKCSGRLIGGNCRGPRKVERLDDWLDSHDMRRVDIELTAYGDSSGDTALLGYADHGHWVEPTTSNAAPPRPVDSQ